MSTCHVARVAEIWARDGVRESLLYTAKRPG